MKRRHLLQSTGATLAAFGWNQLSIRQQGDRYGKVLAQNTSRKLALLVGINKYPGQMNRPLKGCLTDVEMQRNLLVYGFGFNQNDIRTVTDEQATREGILTAIEEHLIQQAQPGDVVVFHFSGHGSRIFDPDGIEVDSLNSTLVPIDSTFDSGETEVNDIMGKSLFLLMAQVKTEQLTVVLDCCYSGGIRAGNGRVRAISREGATPSPVELNFQNTQRERLGWSVDEFRQQRMQQRIPKGVRISSAKPRQEAIDAPFDGFDAGVFTYLMTRYLWQQTQNDRFDRVVASNSLSTEIYAIYAEKNPQQPQADYNPPTNAAQWFYFVETQKTPAEAVITDVQGDRVQLWLGGVDKDSLPAFRQDTVFSVVDPAANTPPTLITLLSRQGLVGEAIWQSGAREALQPGRLLQERIRLMPENFSLHIGLDDRSLSAGEISTATNALNAIDRVNAVPLGQEEVQAILARMTDEYVLQVGNGSAASPEMGSLGLFSPSLDAIVPTSFGNAGESVLDAIDRLQAKLRLLVAIRLVKLMLNAEASQLDVEVSMARTGENNLLASRITPRGQRSNTGRPRRGDRVPEIANLNAGDRVEFTIGNYEAQDLYCCVLLVSPSGGLTVLFPSDWRAPEEAAIIVRGSIRQVPDTRDSGIAFEVVGDFGASEVLAIVSTTPLRNTLKALQDLASGQNISRGLVSASGAIDTSLIADFRGTDVTQFAVFSIPFQVVATEN
jgi:Caspase domain/Domain of unknown function (DUF4384)